MGWVKVSDDFYDHPKFDGLTAIGDATWIRGLAYANRNLRDGYIGKRAALQLVNCDGLDAQPQDGIDELVLAGLWIVAEKGYTIHDYLEYQSSAAQIKERADANRKRVAAYTDRKRAEKLGSYPQGEDAPVDKSAQRTSNANNVKTGHSGAGVEAQAEPRNHAEVDAANAPANGVANALANGATNGAANGLAHGPLHHTPTPTPTPLTTTIVQPAAAPAGKASPYSAEFETWYKEYPRKNSKGDAFKAWEVWRKKKQLAPLDEMVAGAVRYAKKRRGEDPQFTQMPGTWLRARGWEDEDAAAAAAAPINAMHDERQAQLVAWLAARDTTLAEYNSRKAESGWLDSLKLKGTTP